MREKDLMKGVDGILFINLANRQDRFHEFQYETKRIGIEAERFPAVPHRYGTLGCLKSHLGALKLAQKRGWRNVLIFEDDFQWIVSKEVFHSQMEQLFTSSEDYDVVMLGYNLKRSKEHSELLLKVEEAQTASGYLVHSRFYKKLIDLYEQTVPMLETTLLFSIYACDQVWKKLQSQAKWYAFRQRIGVQRPGYSDNTQKFEDYGC